MIDVVPKPKTLGKQLFLSRHVVTESSEFDGGVLVNEDGIIEAVLKRDIINSLLSQNLNDLKVFLFYLALNLTHFFTVYRRALFVRGHHDHRAVKGIRTSG